MKQHCMFFNVHKISLQVLFLIQYKIILHNMIVLCTVLVINSLSVCLF